jgi:two-component system, chemotaxis family, response regulator Rcp1
MLDTHFGRPINLLIVEDNPGDVRLIKEALREGRVKNHIHAVADGEEAIAYLYKQNDYSNSPRPDLILLDLNLPRKDGREVLAQIKSDKKLNSIPVVILTSSEAEKDILKAYDLNANCFITKPVELEQFLNVVKSIEDFWLTVVKLP